MMEHNDIYRILENLDAAQRSVKQLPALFQPKDTSPQLSGPYPGQNATLGYLVGEGEDTSLDDMTSMGRAVMYRIANQHPEWFMKYGREAVMKAIQDATGGEDDWEEIGSSDVSAYVNMVHDQLRDRGGDRSEMADRRPFAETKDTATEDVLSTVKKKLGDYLQDVATAIRKDPDLMAKLPQTTDDIKAVKTMKTADGHEIKITGNEDDGFRISIKNKNSRTKFANLDEATMAVEMFCARRRSAAESQDYIEEA